MKTVKRNVALIILYDTEKKLLLQHRDEGIKILPGYWALFGGEIEAGETPEEAVKRECYEELGFILKTPKLVMEQKYNSHGFEGTKNVFIEECLDKSKLALHEGQSMDWFNIEETKKLKIVDHDRKVLEKIIGIIS